MKNILASQKRSVTCALVSLFSLSIAVLVNGQVFGASFNCGLARTSVERMICSESVLSNLDEELAAAYRRFHAASTQHDELEQQQKQWLGFRDLCRNVACLRRAYWERIAELSYVPVITKSPLPVTPETKAAIGKLPTSDICKLAFDENFIQPRTACIEKTEDGSCLVWGETVNRDNYRELLNTRNISERACKQFGGAYLFSPVRASSRRMDRVGVLEDEIHADSFLARKFKEHNLVLGSDSDNAYYSNCMELSDHIGHGNLAYLLPDVATDDYDSTSTERFRAYCPNTDYRYDELGGLGAGYTASKAFEFYEITKQTHVAWNTDNFVVYAEGWRRVEMRLGEKSLVYAWPSGTYNGGIFRAVNKRTCESQILFNGSARYNYMENKPTTNRSGLFDLNGKLHSYSFTGQEREDGSINAFVTIEAYGAQMVRDYSCTFEPDSEVQNKRKQDEQRFKEAYNAAKEYSRPNSVPSLCDHNGPNMYSCARENSRKMQDYYQNLIYVTAIHKIPGDSERKFIEQYRLRYDKIAAACGERFDQNSPEGKWATNVCFYTDLVGESENILRVYWR